MKSHNFLNPATEYFLVSLLPFDNKLNIFGFATFEDVILSFGKHINIFHNFMDKTNRQIHKR